VAGENYVMRSIICALHHKQTHHIKEKEMDGACSAHGDEQCLLGTPRRSQDNIKMGLTETVGMCTRFIELRTEWGDGL
jgi:hypothetical protein